MKSAGITSSLSLLLLRLLVLPFLLQQFTTNVSVVVQAFANWLPCFVDMEDETEVVMNHNIQNPEQGPFVVHVQVRLADAKKSDPWKFSLDYPPNTKTRVHTRILAPPEAGDRALQYAMEVSTPGAKFIAPQMCEGVRTYGASQDDHNILEIDGESETVELWAAWAGDHEPVSMTPRIALYRQEEKSEL